MPKERGGISIGVTRLFNEKMTYGAILSSAIQLKMRDLLFKNLTSTDKRRKVIASSETVDKQGVRSIIHRHFVCIVKEIKDKSLQRPLPYLYILKEHNTREQKERFFCRIKGSIYGVNNGRLFLILFMHSLKVNIIAIPYLTY